MISGAPILVVGARTTGMTMACELIRHGAQVRIIDESDGIEPHVRATVLHSRTLEIFQDIGIVDEILEQGVKLRGLRHHVDGRVVRKIPLGGVDSPYPLAIALGQNRTEAVLERQLCRLGTEVEWATEMIDTTQHADHVEVSLRNADGREEKVETPWLIGCDGAHSITRRIYCEGFPGEEDPHDYLLADVVAEGTFEQDEAHAFLTDDGSLVIVPLPDGRALLIAEVHGNRDPVAPPPTLDDVQAVVTARGPVGTKLREPRWLTHFRVNYRLANHYRHNRVFLAGDAAHIHSPFGGQGMNTGIQDAYNLAWKLALVASRRASTNILDSYELERRDVARDVLECTRAANTEVVEWAHLSDEQRRRAEWSFTLPEPDRLRIVRHDEELDLDYRKSPICVEDVAHNFAGGPHAGAQAPDAEPLEFEGRTLTLFELLRGTKHALLVFAGGENGGRRAVGARELTFLPKYSDRIDVYFVTPPTAITDLPMQVREVRDVSGALKRRYEADTARWFLIRPDGYIAYRGAPPNSAQLQRYLDKVF